VTAAVGLADVEGGRAMTPETRMLAASIGETFLAAIVLALENEGSLSRADLLSAYLGDRPWFEALPNPEAITIDQLLHHTSGLPDHVHLPEFQQSWAGLTSGERFNPEALVVFVVGRAPLFDVGTAWAYSATGYVLLGIVIEEVSRRPWHEAIHQRFLAPLGLTGTIASDRPDLPGLAIGYIAPDNPFGMPERTADAEGWLLWNPIVESAGGGFASTSADLARWGQVLSGGEAMSSPYLDRLLGGVPVDPDAAGILYSAGIAIYANTPRGPVWGHGGWIPGYVSSLRHYPDHGSPSPFRSTLTSASRTIRSISSRHWKPRCPNLRSRPSGDGPTHSFDRPWRHRARSRSMEHGRVPGNDGGSRGALLHELFDSRASPFPGQIYPTASVTGMPSAV
jgi:D-alanyl-D-alanine carboxypeptidase